MKKRKIFSVIAVLMVSVMLLAACGGGNQAGNSGSDSNTEVFVDKDPSEYEGTLTIMVHSEQLAPIFQKFEEAYPNVKIDMQLVPGEEQLTKITNMVQAGVDVPDLYTCRTQFVGLLTEAEGYYANLSQAPFDGEALSKNLVPYTVDMGSDPNGGIRVLSWQAPVGGVFYRRSLAIEYFGTDDPEEVSKLFADYDTWIETAKIIKEKSGGEVKAFSEFNDLYNVMRFAGTKGWVTDGKLTIDDNMEEIFEYAKTIYTEDLDLKLQKYQPGFFAAIENQQLFGMPAATWALNFNLMPSSPDTAGDWGLASAANSFQAGGTYIGIYEKSEQKELAWQFMKFLFGNEEAIEYYATTAGDYVSNMVVSKKIAELSEEERAEFPTFTYMGNQNIYEFYNNEVAGGVNSAVITKYDERFDAYIRTVMEAYCEGNMTYEEAIEQFKEDVATNAPEVIIE